MNKHIQVFARLRPLLDQHELEAGAVDWKVEHEIVQIDDPAMGQKTLRFDQVFDGEAGNEQVYKVVGESVVDNVLNGFNGTILAYGQTGSGKTHTMGVGARGILERSIHSIFDGIRKQHDTTFLLRVAYFEIYKERINDLLQDDDEKRKNLKILKEDDALGVVIQGLKEVIVDSPETVFDLLENSQRPHTRSTAMNTYSSRSHSIFRLVIESRPLNDQADTVNVSVLSLVDLAGSERQSNARTSGDSLKEGAYINKSLLALREVISGLSQKKNTSTYRNSKLTRVLKQSLGGNALTSLICNVNSCSSFKSESFSTLLFGVMCKRIENRAFKNEIGSEKALIEKYRKQVQNLRKELDQQRERAESMQKELEVKTEELEIAREEEEAKEQDATDIATKYALRAQRWWRKAELERLQTLREESEKNKEKAKQLEERLECLPQELSAKSPAGRRRGRASFSYVVNSIDTAETVLQFASNLKKLKAEKYNPDDLNFVKADRERVALVLEETLKKLENETKQVEQLRQYCRDLERETKEKEQTSDVLLPQDRLDAIAKWENDMRQWHAESEEYNQETDERAKLVEEEAARIEEEGEELEQRWQELQEWEDKLKQMEAEISTRVIDKANELVHEYSIKSQQLEVGLNTLKNQTQSLEEEKRQLPIHISQLAQAEAEQLFESKSSEFMQMLDKRDHDIELQALQLEVSKESLKNKEDRLKQRENQLESEIKQGQLMLNKAKMLEEQLDLVEQREKALQKKIEMNDKVAAELSRREAIVNQQESTMTDTNVSESLRRQLLEAREATLSALETKLRTCLATKVAPALEQLKHINEQLNVDSFDYVNKSEVKLILQSVAEPFEWLQTCLDESEGTQSFLQSISQHITGIDFDGTSRREEHARTTDDRPRQHLFQLAETLGHILKVSIPIIANTGNTGEVQDLKFKRRLLSRHLSEAKMILLKHR